MKYTGNIFERLFVLMTLGLNNMNKATYVAGRKVYDRSRDNKWMDAADIDASADVKPAKEQNPDN